MRQLRPRKLYFAAQNFQTSTQAKLLALGLVEKYNNTSRSLLRLQYNNTSRSLLCLQYNNTSRSLLCLQYNNTSHSPVCIHPKLFSTNSRLCSKDEEKKEQVGIVARFKKMAKDYWYVLIPVHLVTSTVWMGGFYLMLKSGVDVVAIMEACYVPEKILDKLRNSQMGYYALTYACYKIATPARYTVTLAGTTYSISKLKEMGYLKTSSEYAATVKGKTDDIKEKIEEKKDKVKEKYSEKKETMKQNYEDGKDKFKDEWESSWEKYGKSKRK